MATAAAVNPSTVAAPSPIAITRSILKSRPRSRRCCTSCKGWAIFEANHVPSTEIEACDECNSIAERAGAPTVSDDEVARLPEARASLARALVPARPRWSRARLRDARAAALREHDLQTALYTVHLWASPETHTRTRHEALQRIRATASEALDLDCD
jgi:hypothetical protein